MSSANKCDKCAATFEREHGCLSFEMVCVGSRKTTKDGSRIDDTWSDVDFCKTCSAEILVLIGPALNGIEETLRAKAKRSIKGQTP